MQATAFTIELPVSKQHAFNYIANLDHLPEWAPGFALEMKRDNGALKVTTPMGDMFLRVVADEATGVIDMYANPDEAGTDYLGTRLLTAPDGRTLYTVTFFRDPGLSDAEFAQHCLAMQRDLENIRRCLS